MAKYGQAMILKSDRQRQAVAMCKTKRSLALFLLSLKAGLRSVEIAGCRWENLDPDGKVLHLKQTKGDEARTIPLNADLLAALVDYMQDTRQGWMFTNTNQKPGQGLTAGAVSAWFDDLYRRKLGWTGYSSHSGRRTFVTELARQLGQVGGASLKDVQEIVGHKDLKTTQRYIETDPDAQQKLVDLI